MTEAFEELSRKYQFKYTFTAQRGGPTHIWSALGAKGGLHLHIHDRGKESEGEVDGRYYGGVEIHYRSPPERMKQIAPSDNKCWLLECPCWTDGSSCWARDDAIPFWEADPHDHVRMFVWLGHAAESRFNEED